MAFGPNWNESNVKYNSGSTVWEAEPSTGPSPPLSVPRLLQAQLHCVIRVFLRLRWTLHTSFSYLSLSLSLFLCVPPVRPSVTPTSVFLYSSPESRSLHEVQTSPATSCHFAPAGWPAVAFYSHSHTCTHTHTHTHTHAFTHTHTHSLTHRHRLSVHVSELSFFADCHAFPSSLVKALYIYIYIHIYTFIYIYKCIYIYRYIYISIYTHYCSKVWCHPDNLVFSMKTHTFIYQINCKINIKSSQDIDEVINNDCYCKY